MKLLNRKPETFTNEVITELYQTDIEGLKFQSIKTYENHDLISHEQRYLLDETPFYGEFKVLKIDDIKDFDFSEWYKSDITYKDIDPIKNTTYYWWEEGHILFDAEWNVVPFIIKWDYIGTPFHNGVLKLKKAIRILKEHPWVMNKDELEIKDIEYYNRDEERTKYIEVALLPDKKTYNEIYQKVKDNARWHSDLKNAIHDYHEPNKEHNYLGLLEAVRE